MVNLAKRWRWIGSWLLVSVISQVATAEESVEIIRDRWGIAHVFAEDEQALFYGAGYAMAEDRLLQMMIVRAEAEGRLAALLGPGENGRFVDSDKTYRLLGFDRHARRLLDHVQPDTRRALEAFAAGVNAYADAHADHLSIVADFFPKKPRAWEAADCLSVWSRYAYQFTRGWENEVQALRRYEQWVQTRAPGEPFPGAQLIREDSAAIVTEEEFRRTSPEVYERLKKVAATPAPAIGWFGPPPDSFKASHNWVVSGQRSTTGRPILESNPQIPVSFPTLMYEIHLAGGQYDVRGITFPGTPAIFIGWNRHCAWGATALGGDHADLFEERLDPHDSTRYLHKGTSLPLRGRTETIAVKGRDPIELVVRETIHGPIVNVLLEEVKEDELFALRHTILANAKSSLEAQMTMMRAVDWASFRDGMAGYVAPACNMIFADEGGDIGYQALVTTPKRRGLQPLPRKGWTGDEEWEIVPFEEMPTLLNPDSQTIFTANHLPVGSWYPYLVSTSRGEGPRSWRIRELLAGDRPLSVEDFHQQIHLDSTNPGVRDFVTLATRVLREEGAVSPQQFEVAVSALERWDGRLATDSPAYPFARSVLDVLLAQTRGGAGYFAQFGSDWAQYGGSWNGLNGVIKHLMSEYRETDQTPAEPGIRRWLTDSLVNALQEANTSRQHEPPITHRMPYQNNLGQWGSLAPQYDRNSPPLTCPVTQTIWSQAGETYVQIVDLSDIDRSLSLLPPGVSEDPSSPHADDQIPLWVQGKMHPAPLTREGVLAVKESVRHLTWQKP